MSAEGVTEHVVFDVSGQIATVTLNRPGSRNALSIAANERLLEIWNVIDRDDGIRAVVLTSADCGVFCAGMDLKESAQLRTTTGQDMLEVLRDPYFERMREVTKPVIAAINGDFTAAGMVLAMNSDLRVGLQGARAGIAEAKYGRGTSWALPLLWMLPQAVLSEMIFTADFIPVERLRELGFLNYIEASPGAVKARCYELAEKIVRCAPLSVSAAKASLAGGIALGESAGTRLAKELHKKVYASDDAREGPRAFAEKRLPLWKNR